MLACTRSRFTGKERDTETGLDSFPARYFGSNMGRWISPDPIGGYQEDPQTLNRYVYVRNNPLRYTDPTGLDFYLKCTQTKDNTDTCQDGHQGTTDKKGNFTPTVVSSDKDGNLVDQNGNKYSGTFDGKNVNFTQNGTNQSSSGDWKQGSNDTTGIHGTGNYENFDFTFKNHNEVQTLFAEWTYRGTSDQTKQALERAGFVHWWVGGHLGRIEYRLPADGRNSLHFNIANETKDPKSGVPRTSGDFHNNEYYSGSHMLDHFWHDVLKK